MACSKCTATCRCVLKANDTTTVDHTLEGAGTKNSPWRLTSEVILTPDEDVDGLDPDGPNPGPGNLIKRGDANGSTGIYVSCEDVQDCVGGMVSGLLDGLEFDDDTDSLVVCISEDDDSSSCLRIGDDGCLKLAVDPDPTNALQCDTGPSGSGLYVAGGGASCVSTDPDSSSCLQVGTDGCLKLLIAPDQPGAEPGQVCENDLQCLPDGLFIHLPESLAYQTAQPARGNQEYPSTFGDSDYPRGGNVNLALRFYNPADNGLDDSEVPLGVVTNPDPCCPMNISVEGALSNFSIDNNDLCQAVAAYQAVANANGIAPNRPFTLLVEFSLEARVNGDVPPAGAGGTLQSSRTLRINYSPAVYPQCGILSGNGGADNDIPPFQLAPGETATLGYRIFGRIGINYAAGSDPGTGLADPATDAFIRTMWAGIAPYGGANGTSQLAGMPSFTGFKVTGSSDCRNDVIVN